MRSKILILLIYCLTFFSFSSLAEEAFLTSSNSFISTSHSLFNVDIAQLKLNTSTQITTSVSTRSALVFESNLPTPTYDFEPRCLERLKNIYPLSPNYFSPLQFFEILII